MVSVPVVKAFTHEGRALSIGSTITVSPMVAAVLHRRGLVSLTRQYVTAVVPPDQPAPPEPAVETRRRRYRRRDLTAESA